MRVEEANQRPDRARRVVVLGLAEQQRAATLEVAQVDVVAQRRAERAAAAVDREHDLGLGVVPGRARVDAHVGAQPHGRHRRRLGEDLGVGSDAHLQVLRPGALRDQHTAEVTNLAVLSDRKHYSFDESLLTAEIVGLFVVVGLGFFAAWMRESERRVRFTADLLARTSRTRRKGLLIPLVFVYLAGHLSNMPTNMQQIQDPRQHEPHSAMPDIGVTDADARYIAAYLYTLR